MTISELEFENLLTTLRKLSSIVIVSHENPDSDAHGSGLGLMFLLKGLGLKNIFYCNSSPTEKKYKLLPGIDETINEFPKNSFEKCGLVYVDCATKLRIGPKLDLSGYNFKSTINIDHHSSNENFADINLVDPKASSTSEIIAKLAISANYKSDKNMATCLLAGIIGDTGSYRYSQTSATTFKVSAWLFEAGADHQLVANRLYSSITKSNFEFRNLALSKASFFFNEMVAGIVVTKDLLDSQSVTEDATEGLVEALRDIEGVRVAFIAKEGDTFWRVSLRSHVESDDVSMVADKFGGGGHRCAAAFRFSGQYQELLPKLLSLIEPIL